MGNLEFIDLEPSQDSFLDAVLTGLSAAPKTLPAKFFYDARGSELFARITALPEYYPTRTETTLLKAIGPELKALIPGGSKLVEFGSGSTEKVRILIDTAQTFATYIPIDISGEYLKAQAKDLASDHPDLAIIAICADYTRLDRLPGGMRGGPDCTGFFPGSTIGNMTPDQAIRFLSRIARLLGKDAGLLIGADLKKDPAILNAAYNDAQGVTAAFNRNVLNRINEELAGDFDLGKFRHKAFYNEDEGRIEMHLESLADQSVTVSGRVFRFAKGETIHTENSYKFTREEFQGMAQEAGFEPIRYWQDRDALFSIHFLKVN